MTSLYQIASEFRGLVDRLMDTQDDQLAIADTIEAEQYPLELKAQQVAYAARNLESLAEQIKAAEKQMADRRKAIENRAMHIREYIKTSMEIAGVEKIECPHFALSIKKNPPSVDVFEPALVPAEYMRQPEPPPPAIDKTAIKEAIKAGKEVPGAKMAQGTRLDIK